nr:sugar ABC transporter permease [Paenibacillus polysaccharolyticus]
MLSPFILLVSLFFVAPVVITAVMAFTDMDYAMIWNFVRWGNIGKLLSDPNIVPMLWNTFVYVSGTLVINVAFALLLALLTTYFITNERTGLFFRMLWMLPRITPSVVYAMLWLWFLDASDLGLFNAIRKILFGSEPVSWLFDNPMLIVILANGMVGASFGMIIFSSAIKSIPQDLFKAARVDGTTEWSIVREIIMPAIKWPIMFVSIWQLLSLLTSYEYILLITDGGPMFDSEVLALYSYHTAFSNLEFGYGAALALVLVIIALILTIIQFKIFNFNKMVRSSRID